MLWLLVVAVVEVVLDMEVVVVVLVDIELVLLQSEHIQYQQLFKLVLVQLH
jgi:hypothetical protein